MAEPSISPVPRIARAAGVALTFLGVVTTVQALPLHQEAALQPASVGGTAGSLLGPAPFLALGILGMAAGMVLLLAFRPRPRRG